MNEIKPVVSYENETLKVFQDSLGTFYRVIKHGKEETTKLEKNCILHNPASIYSVFKKSSPEVKLQMSGYLSEYLDKYKSGGHAKIVIEKIMKCNYKRQMGPYPYIPENLLSRFLKEKTEFYTFVSGKHCNRLKLERVPEEFLKEEWVQVNSYVVRKPLIELLKSKDFPSYLIEELEEIFETCSSKGTEESLEDYADKKARELLSLDLDKWRENTYDI